MATSFPGVRPTPSDQGEAEICVREALSKCVVSAADRMQPQIDLDQKSTAAAILHTMKAGKNIEGIWPEKYSNQEILVMDERTKKWFTARLEVNKLAGGGVAEYDVNRGEYLLVYRTNVSGQELHAVYVEELVLGRRNSRWKCINSWGRVEPNPEVPVNQAGNVVYRIDVHISPAQSQPLHTSQPSKMICVVGGSTNESSFTPVNTMELYNPSSARKWINQERMATPRWGVAMAVLKNKIYAIGGADASYKYPKTVEVFDPRTGCWQASAEMNGEREGAGAAVIDDKIVVCGGWSVGGNKLDTVEVYSATTRRWTRMPDMNKRRGYPAVVELNGEIYVLGGAGENGAESSVEVFNEAGQRWVMPVHMRMMSQRWGHGAAAVDGKIYVVGGHSGGSALRSGEVYDPELRSWSKIADMKEARQGVAVVGHNGQIWAMGGANGGNALATVEVYSVATDTWKPVERMSAPRYLSGAGLLSV